MVQFRTILLLLLTLAMTSCLRKEQLEFVDPVQLFKADNYDQFLMAHQLDIIATKDISNHLTIERPASVWKLLFHMVHDAKTGDKFLNRTCLYYRVPFKNQKKWGELKSMTIPLANKCGEELVIIRQSSLDSIKNLTVHFSPEEETFQQEKIPPFQMALFFEIYRKAPEWPFYSY